MLIYIDKEFKCHTEAADNRTPVDVEFFDGKCTTFIKGHRFIPDGESLYYMGNEFRGEMLSAIESPAILAAAQREYETAQNEMEEMLNLLESGETE